MAVPYYSLVLKKNMSHVASEKAMLLTQVDRNGYALYPEPMVCYSLLQAALGKLYLFNTN